MLQVRFIPCLLLKGDALVKTVNFKKSKYIGDPINTVRIFNEKEVDELLFLDIDASPLNKEPNYTLLAEIASECFMPLGYGGGISNIEQVKKIFSIGVEKIAINSAAHSNPNLIKQIVDIYGSQAVIGVIDVKKSLFGKYEVVSKSATVKHKYSPAEWAKNLEKQGVGEILITSVDREGTWSGMDIELIKSITSIVNLPVIAHGGAGTIDNILEAVNKGGASAVAMGSMVVYQKKDMGVLINFPDRNKLNMLKV
ncbi:MAG TPA: AglZ/HisF2 family acetamidino modification protein [Bacteroidia bacterium]|jgi:cyclase|nr:AglZ/HisF2 family acetamidino modification protein [Bacteroidia bacterium]